MLVIFETLLVILLIAGFAGAMGWKNISYRLLLKDISKWQKQGWITAEGAEAILRDKRPVGLGNRLVFLVGLLGAILLLFAAISFVAANWEEMSRLSRLTWLIVALWIAYLAGWRLVANNHPLLAELAYIVGVGLFGINIVLIAQMFHIDSHPPSGVLMWTLGALISAALLSSRAALILTFVGAISWSIMEISTYGVVIHWPFLLVWGLATFLAVWWRWTIAYHPALLTLLTWLLMTIVSYGVDDNWLPQAVLVTMVMLFYMLLAGSFAVQENKMEFELDGFEFWLERYSIVGLVISLFVLQMPKLESISKASSVASTISWLPVSLLLLIAALVFLVLTWREKLMRNSDFAILASIGAFSLVFALLAALQPVSKETFDFIATWIYGAAFLALMIWLMMFGHRRLSDSYVWIALVAFAAQVLYIYFRLFGTLLETSLFFLVGGILTLSLSFVLYRVYQRIDSMDGAQEEAGK